MIRAFCIELSLSCGLTFEKYVFPFQSGAQRAQAESDKTFHEMLQAVERWKAEIHQMITANMQSAMSQAEGYVDRLEQEIQELQRRGAELRQILETEDNIHFLQVPKVFLSSHFWPVCT